MRTLDIEGTLQVHSILPALTKKEGLRKYEGDTENPSSVPTPTTWS